MTASKRTDGDRTTVWLFITALCVGGAEQTLIDLANGLDEERYDVTVWTVFDATPLAENLRSGVPVRSLTSAGRVENSTVVGVTNPLAYFTVLVKFCYLAATEQPDVIHSFLYIDNILAGVAGLFAPSTIITGVRSVPNDPRRIRVILDRVTILLSDFVVSNSEAGKELAVTRGASESRVSVVHNGRDISTYQRESTGELAAELGIEDELVVGTVGRLIERKGHFELITAWATLQESGIDARLMFVGDGPDRAALERHAKENGCTDSVEFLGTRRDVPELLSLMDVFVFPSHFEGLPGAVIEAMAAGLPVTATPVDGTAELLDNYRTGLFVSPQSPDELSWVLRLLLETPSLRESLGTAAQEEAQRSFTINTMVEEFDALYRELVDTEQSATLAEEAVTTRPDLSSQ